MPRKNHFSILKEDHIDIISLIYNDKRDLDCEWTGDLGTASEKLSDAMHAENMLINIAQDLLQFQSLTLLEQYKE